MNLYIDVGHGGKQTGAVCSSDKIVYEKDLNLVIASQVYVRVQKYFDEVVMSRNNDDTMFLDQRMNYLRKNRYDYCISIHCNAFSDPTASGFEVLYYPTEGNKELARSMFRCMHNTLDYTIRPRATKERTDIGILQAHNHCCMVECGFMSNTAELRELLNPRTQMKLATGIAQGIVYYIRALKMSEDEFRAML